MRPRVGLAILALVIYGSAVLSLHQDRFSGWQPEVGFSLAAAVSYSVYRTPLGMAERNVYNLFRSVSQDDAADRVSVQEAMRQTTAGSLPAGGLVKTTTDGIGASYPIFASLAMRLLGRHLSALTYCFLLLMSVSTLAFISRFRDERLFVVPLLYFALTLMLLSPLTSDKEVMDQIPIGGYRYFTIAGILPALHVFFEVADRSRRETPVSDLILLGLQAFILTFVVLARGSAGYLLALIVLAVLFRLWENRRSLPTLGELLGKIVFVILVGTALVSITSASVPDYGKSGRFFGIVWHRAFASFGLHPDWPFGNLRQVYDCTDIIPGGLTRDVPDRDGACVFWSSYPPAAAGDLDEIEVDEHLYDNVYEKVLRSAFLNVVRSYPRQILELYVYYKSEAIFNTLQRVVQFDLSTYSTTSLALAALQFVVFVTFVGWGAYQGTGEITPRVAGIMPALFVFSLLPLYVAWSNLSTSIDTIAFMFASLAVIFGILVQTPIDQIFRVPKGDIPSLLSTRVRLNILKVVGLLAICSGAAWASRTYLVPDDIKTDASQTSAHVSISTRATDIAELPLLSETPLGPDRWDFIDGLSAEAVDKPPVVFGQRILRLVAVGADSGHALGARFGGLAPDQVYRAIAWVKAEPDVRFRIEARDGKPSNFGVTRFNLTARSVLNSKGDILASGVEAAGDSWVKVWVDLRSSDGEVFVSIGMLEGPSDLHVFKSAGQEMTFGGFEISPPRPVQTSVQVSIPTRTTDIAELPLLSETPLGPDRWDFIDGLSAEAVDKPPVVFGQRILRLVAVGADSGHALGARFGGLAPDQVYRAIAWVKAEPDVRFRIEARDGKPSNFGVTRFNLTARSVLNSKGDILASGVEAAGDSWVKVWVDLRSSDGEVLVSVGLLATRANKPVFTAAGQEMTFGGFEILPRR